MVLPTTIAEPSPLDPLLLLPLPESLPPPPGADLDALVVQLRNHIDTIDSPADAAAAAGSSTLPLPVLSAGMRSANRNAQVLMNAARSGAAEARGRLDEVDVDLRTAEYELARVRDEMALCMEYEPMYESMDMPEEDAFLASASPEVLEALPTDPESRKYALIIARLEAELAAIMAREEQLATLTAERDGLLRSQRELRSNFNVAEVFLTDYSRTTNAMVTKLKNVAVSKAAVDKEKADKADKERLDRQKADRVDNPVAPGSPAPAAPAGAPAS